MSGNNQKDGIVVPFVPRDVGVPTTKRFDAANFSLVGELYVAEINITIENDGSYQFLPTVNNFHDQKTLYGRLTFLGQNGQSLYDTGGHIQSIPGGDQPVIFTEIGASADAAVARVWPGILGVSGFFNVID
jgi:hypothetical protein